MKKKISFAHASPVLGERITQADRFLMFRIEKWILLVVVDNVHQIIETQFTDQ